MDNSLRPLLPLGFQDEPPKPAPARHRRKVTPAACKACQRSRARCDGGRPMCGRCESKRSDCEWDVEQGIGRYATLKLRNAKLEQDLASLQEQYRQSQGKAPNEAASFTELSRSNSSITPVTESIAAEGSTYSQASDVYTQMVQAGQNTAGDVFAVDHTAKEAHTGEKAARSTVGQAKVFTEPTEPPNVVASQSDAIHQSSITALKNGMAAFFQCNGVFYVYSQEDGNTLQQDVLGQLSASDWLDGSSRGMNLRFAISLAEMCGMAAIGLQYTIGPIPSMSYAGSKADGTFEFTASFYRFAKQLLDEMIEFNPMKAMKLCTLLSMYNITTHSSVALAYAETGIHLGEHHGLKFGFHATSLLNDDPADYKRVLRTLVTLRSWLVTALGYLPVREPAMGITTNVGLRAQDIRIEDVIQHEMAKVTMIKSRFMQIAENLRTPTPRLLGTMREDLAGWHDQLPGWMQLSQIAERSPEAMDDQRRVLYFVHLFFLSAIILKSRIVHGMQETRGLVYDSIEMRVAVTEGVEASRSSARILHLLLTSDTVFKRCWLFIFQAYMSGVSLLYAITRRLQARYSSNTWRNDMILARHCLEILKFCATADEVAKAFYETLGNAVHEINVFIQQEDSSLGDLQQAFFVGGVDLSSEYICSPLQEGSALFGTSCRLLEILRQPFANFAQPPTVEAMESIEDFSVGSRIDWRFEVSSPFHGNTMSTGHGKCA